MYSPVIFVIIYIMGVIDIFVYTAYLTKFNEKFNIIEFYYINESCLSIVNPVLIGLICCLPLFLNLNNKDLLLDLSTMYFI